MWEAAKKLVADMDFQAVPKLLHLVNTSPKTERRIASAWVLGFLRSSVAVDHLIKILDNRSEPIALRDQASESLGYICDPKARNVLLRNLLDESADVVFSCAFALRTVGTPEDISNLARLANNSSLVNSYGASVTQEAREAAAQIQMRFQMILTSW
jgi:HEAT repeat protein